MLEKFYKLHSVFNISFNLHLHKYGFVIYLNNNLQLVEINNIKIIIQKLGGSSFFFTSKIFKLHNQYLNCFVITFPNLLFSINFPYYLSTIFSTFNYFPLYFKFNKNLISINNNFFLASISNLFNTASEILLSSTLLLQKKRIFVLFKFFFNFFSILKSKKTQCQP